MDDTRIHSITGRVTGVLMLALLAAPWFTGADRRYTALELFALGARSVVGTAGEVYTTPGTSETSLIIWSRRSTFTFLAVAGGGALLMLTPRRRFPRAPLFGTVLAAT